MPRLKLLRGPGPLTTAVFFWDVYRRLTPSQRRWVAKQVRTHGPSLAKRALRR